MSDKAKRNVLIVEDEHALCMLYSQVLKDAGFDVDTAVDGDEAYTKILETNWNFILLDIMLPKRDGVQILKDLKSHEGWKKGVVILLTNLNNQEIIETGFSLGVDAYLIKSEITPDKIVDEIMSFNNKDTTKDDKQA